MGERKIDIDYESDIKPKVKLDIVKGQRDTERIFSEQFLSLNNKISEAEKTLSNQSHSLHSTTIRWMMGLVISLIAIGGTLHIIIINQFGQVDEKFSLLNARLDRFSEVRGVAHSSSIERNDLINIKSLNEIRENPADTKALKGILNSSQE